MADVDWSYKLRIGLKRFPPLHRPARWLNRVAWAAIKRTGIDLTRWFSPASPQWGPPKGTFAILPDLRAGKITGRVVLEDQGQPKLAPDSLLVACKLNQHGEQPWPVLWSRHSEARLTGPSLALMNERKQLASESLYGPGFLKDDPSYNTLRLPPALRLEGSWTSLASRWTPNSGVPTFSHWILDALPRLAVLDEFPPDTRILVPAALAGYQKESLKLLGLLDRVRYTPEQHLVVENYYFSSPTTMVSCHNPYGVGFLRRAFLPKADMAYAGAKKIFIQRKGKNRGIQNDAEVTDYFRRLGWAIIDTEKLTFAQEIKLFSEAEAVAGILGSGFTNCLWSPPGCKVITFVAGNWLDGWVEWICDVNRLDYHYAIFPADHALMARVDLPTVKKLLAAAGLPVSAPTV